MTPKKVLPDDLETSTTGGSTGDAPRASVSKRFLQNWSWSSRRLLIELFGIGSFYVVVIAFCSARIPGFLSYPTAETVLAGATVLGLVSIGQTFAIISGGFDLSVGGVVALGAVVFAEVANRSGLMIGLLAAVAVGLCVGLINGVLIARVKVDALITTLAMLSVTGGAAYLITDGETVALGQAHFGLWGDVAIVGLQYGTLALIVLVVLATLVLRHTTYGRAIYTIGGNQEAARLAGMKVDFVSASVYVLSGACAAFAGVVAASRLLAGSPTIGADTTLNSVAAVVLGGAALGGGVGGIPGTVLGVLLLGTTSVGLALLRVASFYQVIVTGLILLTAVLFGRVRELLVARDDGLEG